MKLLKRNKELLKNKGGFTSIIIAIMLLMAVTIVTYLTDSNSQDFIFREVEGIMEVSAINTFNRTISIDLMKKEIFGFDTGGQIGPNDPDGTYTLPNETVNLINSTYKEELKRQAANNDSIVSAEIKQVNLEFAKSPWGGGLSTKSRPYLVLESYVVVTVRHMQAFDYSVTYANRKFDSYRTDTTEIEITDIGTPQDGEMAMVIRCTSRLFQR